MLNYLWGFMLLIGIVFGCINGKLPEITQEALCSAKEAVKLAITMMGVMGFWMGLLEIGSRTGLLAGFSKALQPFMHFLFPRLLKEGKAREAISTNFAANILGLGWAATPAGLKAMDELKKIHSEECRKKYPDSYKMKEKVASDEMCTFLVLNISSLQLIPMTMVAYRSEYGSVNPVGIVGPAICATLASTLAAIFFCKIMTRKKRRC